jgi:transcriptional regulator with XRE-family HTH domain
MGRRRISEAELTFRDEVAQGFDRARKDRGLNQTEAARELGVTRQAFSQYILRKTTPQSEILARACTRWNLKLRYRGHEFGAPAFAQTRKQAERTDSFQLGLFDRPQRVENDQLVVILERADRGTLQVTIKMKMKKAPLIGSSRERTVRVQPRSTRKVEARLK